MDEFPLNDDVNEDSMVATVALDSTDGAEAIVCSNVEVVDDR